jgi:hypothetical protein
VSVDTREVRAFLIGKGYLAGICLNDLANVFGISKERVRQILADRGVERRRPGRPPGPLACRIERQIAGGSS